jgi:hypothetical protein
LGAKNFKLVLDCSIHGSPHTWSFRQAETAMPLTGWSMQALGLATDCASFKHGWKIIHFLLFMKINNRMEHYRLLCRHFHKMQLMNDEKSSIASIHTLVFVCPHSFKHGWKIMHFLF